MLNEGIQVGRTLDGLHFIYLVCPKDSNNCGIFGSVNNDLISRAQEIYVTGNDADIKRKEH
jgi:hypothetical protein